MSRKQHSDLPGSKIRSAIALRYNGREAPVVSARGLGETAEQILALAAEHGVHVHQDDTLAQLLEQLQLDQSIPRELYQAVAEIIAYVYTLQGRFPEHWSNPHQRVDQSV